MTGLRIVSTTIAGGARADVIGAALAAVAPLVDQCIVIDTGLTDDSMQHAAAACGDKLAPLRWQWCDDFSAARNFALAQGVAAGADWVLTADTDEVLHLPGLRTALEWCAADVVIVPSSCGMFGHPRLISARAWRAGARWAEPVHECLTGVVTQTAAPDGLGWHFACVRRPGENLLAKYTYYAQILERRTRTAPRAPRPWYYLGDTYGLLAELGPPERAHGRRRAALEAWGRRARLTHGAIYEAAWSCWRAAWLLHQHPTLAGTAGARTPEDWLHRGLQHDPGHVESVWALGWFAGGRGDLRSALACAQKALSMPVPQRMGGFGFPRGWRELPEQLLAHCQAALGVGDTRPPAVTFD